MTSFYVNDLSLDGNYSSAAAFNEALIRILQVRQRSPNLHTVFFCSRNMINLKATSDTSVYEAIMGFSRDLRQLALTWLSARGPFIEDDRQEEEHDLFFFEEEDVTHGGLGEAARRLLHGQVASTFSFEGSARDFQQTPLDVTHGFTEDPIGVVQVQNIWEIEKLIEAAATATLPPTNWQELIQSARESFQNLVIGDLCLETLSRYPFRQGIASRVLVLLGSLNEIMDEMDATGQLSVKGEQLRQKYLVNSDWFSDESDQNKNDFAQEMTFPDPMEPTKKITCFWHGKIRSEQYRLHFLWPIPAPGLALKVAYIGPKISKK